jgi:hypothetical protein
VSRQILGASLVVLLSLAWGAPQPVRALPSTAHRFICYMNAIDGSGQKLGFWDKVTYSLALAGWRNPAEERAGGRS